MLIKVDSGKVCFNRLCADADPEQFKVFVESDIFVNFDNGLSGKDIASLRKLLRNNGQLIIVLSPEHLTKTEEIREKLNFIGRQKINFIMHKKIFQWENNSRVFLIKYNQENDKKYTVRFSNSVFHKYAKAEYASMSEIIQTINGSVKPQTIFVTQELQTKPLLYLLQQLNQFLQDNKGAAFVNNLIPEAIRDLQQYVIAARDYQKISFTEIIACMKYVFFESSLKAVIVEKVGFALFEFLVQNLPEYIAKDDLPMLHHKYAQIITFTSFQEDIEMLDRSTEVEKKNRLYSSMLRKERQKIIFAFIPCYQQVIANFLKIENVSWQNFIDFIILLRRNVSKLLYKEVQEQIIESAFGQFKRCIISRKDFQNERKSLKGFLENWLYFVKQKKISFQEKEIIENALLERLSNYNLEREMSPRNIEYELNIIICGELNLELSDSLGSDLQRLRRKLASLNSLNDA
jgi:hypothetical protein